MNCIVNICSLGRDNGECKMGLRRYYYNFQSKMCKHFMYGGCFGNLNNFGTFDECFETCQNEG